MTDTTPATEPTLQSQVAAQFDLYERDVEKVVLEAATDIFLESLLATAPGVREEDLVQVTLTQHGTVTIYTRDRAQRRRDIRPFKRDAVDDQ